MLFDLLRQGFFLEFNDGNPDLDMDKMRCGNEYLFWVAFFARISLTKSNHGLHTLFGLFPRRYACTLGLSGLL